MRAIIRFLGITALSGLCVTAVAAADVLAAEPSGAGTVQESAEQSKTTEQSSESSSSRLEAVGPAAAPAAQVPRPKVGDISAHGYFRGSFGASNQKGRMTCFQLANPSGLFSKWRLGNECEVWAEMRLSVVTYVGDDGSVATLHFMPTVFIPTTYIGYTPTGVVNSPAQFSTSTGATLSFPNLYVDIKGIPWLAGGTPWMGTRYYKRESVYISDFFYWNPSGVGAGIEDIHLGDDLRLSYAAFAVDGEPGPPSDIYSPPLPLQIDFGVRNDIQLRGIRPWRSGELQLGFQYIADFSNHPDPNGNPVTHSGWGATVQFIQKLLGGDNKVAVQYGKGGGTGFGTLSRFYYPDFSLYFAPIQWRFRAVDVFTIQPTGWLGLQIGLVYQHDHNFLGTPGFTTNWFSGGGRLSVAPMKHLKFLGEAGGDQVRKSNGSDPQWLAKFTFAAAISADRGLLARPELRLFYTWAMWNEAARGATVDSGRLYTASDYLSGAIFGLQAETWW